MAEAIARYLPDCAGGAVGVESCRPTAIRYKPGRSCLVRYKVILRDMEIGTTIKTRAHAELHAGNRAEELWRSQWLACLVEDAARRHPQPPRGRATYLFHLRAILQVCPVDAQLPALVRATCADEMRRVLVQALPKGTGSALGECYPELFRYKPGKRAMLRYRLSGAGAKVLYGKLYRGDGGAPLFDVGHALVAAGVATPRPLAYVPELKLLVYPEAQGRRLRDLRGTTEFEAWMGPVADALADLHQTRVDGLPTYPRQNGADSVLAAAHTIGTLLPELATQTTRLASQLAAHLEAVKGPVATIHGDFGSNVLVSDAGVILLDLDTVRLGNPLLDVAAFLAAQARDDPSGGAERARTAFLDAYASSRPDVREHVALFDAAELLRMAVGPFRRLRPNWPDESERLVRLAGKRLREWRRRSYAPGMAVAAQSQFDVSALRCHIS
jgi:hypothetical protein